MALKIRCPVCRKVFPWDFTAAGGWPEQCLNKDCKSRIGGDRADHDVVMPFISTSGKSKRIDQTYRDMERGSEIRAELAAADAGVPVSEMSSLKITDLRSTKHQGDVAAPPLPAHLQNVGKWQGDGASFSAGISTGNVSVNGHVSTGIEPAAGARTRTMLQQLHGQRTHGVAVSDRPALETTAPNYQRRA